MTMKFALIAAACLSLMQTIGSRSAKEIQRADPRTIPATQVLEAIRLLSSYADVGLPNADTIAGERAFEGTVLAANMLTFEPGSRLVFSAPVGDRTERYIFVRTVIVKGTGGTITWGRDPATKRMVSPVGKAPPGSVGGGDGVPGGIGPDGQPGNPGYPGRSAPTIYLVVNRIEGGPIEIDLRGQDGGEGGPGQTGGDGGLGRPGTRAVGTLGFCRAPGAPGGDGGRGGKGGRGGEGGRGGNGGTLVLLTPEAFLSKISSMLYVDVRPGQGGPGGAGGDGGDGGEAGPGGRAEPPCPPGENGKPGAKGDKGPNGAKGDEGETGLFVKTALTPQQVRSLQLGGEAKK
jgi:hypothetical protein